MFDIRRIFFRRFGLKGDIKLMRCITIFNIRIKINYSILGMVFLISGIFSYLGYWQMSKASKKLAELDSTLELASAEPMDIRNVSFAGPQIDRKVLQARSVVASGRYLLDKNIYLIYRHHKNLIGYEIINPFRLDGDGGIVFVSRGWATASSLQELAEKIELIGGPLTLRGQLHIPEDAKLPESAFPSEKWPLVLREFDVVKVGALFSGVVYPYIVRLGEGERDSLVRYWPIIKPDIGKHFSYSIQWFLMAILVLVAALILSSDLKETVHRWMK